MAKGETRFRVRMQMCWWHRRIDARRRLDRQDRVLVAVAAVAALAGRRARIWTAAGRWVGARPVAINTLSAANRASMLSPAALPAFLGVFGMAGDLYLYDSQRCGLPDCQSASGIVSSDWLCVSESTHIETRRSTTTTESTIQAPPPFLYLYQYRSRQ